MRVLVIGSGAREHALTARLLSERDAGDIICAPGNPGMARIARTSTVSPTDIDGLLALAERESVDFTIVGPELPLSSGIVDRFTSAGHAMDLASFRSLSAGTNSIDLNFMPASSASGPGAGRCRLLRRAG